MLQTDLKQHEGIRVYLNDLQIMHEDIRRTFAAFVCAFNENRPNGYSQAPEMNPIIVSGLFDWKDNATSIGFADGYIATKDGDVIPVQGGVFDNIYGVPASGPIEWVYIELSEIIPEGGTRKIEGTGETVNIMKQLKGVLKYTRNQDVAMAENNIILMENEVLKLNRIGRIIGKTS